MLKQLQKFFAVNSAQPSAQAEQQEESVDLMTTKQEAGIEAADLTIAELTASLASATEALAAKELQYSEVQAELDKVVASLAVIEKEKVEMANAAKAKVLATRSEKLTAIMGTEKAPGIAAALEGLDDATFETVLGTYAASFESESKGAMFTEAGHGAEAVVSTEMSTAERLQAKIDAQFKSTK